MNEEGEAIVVDKVDDVKIEDVKEEVKTESASADEESEARRMGWLPEDEYKGDKSRWRDAKSFLERGKNEVPIMRERMKHMDTQIKELKGTIKEFAQFHSELEKKTYERALKDLKEQQKAAVATANVYAFESIDDQIKQLTESAQKLPTVNFEKKEEEERNAIEGKWLEKNPWAKDKEMQSFAYSVGLHLRNTGNEKAFDEFLDDIAVEVKKLRPEKFKNTRRDDPPAVEDGGGKLRGKGKGFSDLDAEAKAAGDRFIKQGLFKSKEEYAKDYFKLLGE